MPIPVGKLLLYSACGGIHPDSTLPIILDCGTDNTSLLSDPLYIGEKRARIDSGPMYDEFVDRFMEAVRTKYGSQCLVQFEDFGNKNAARLLRKYRQQDSLVFNDDIQGTAAVGLAGILAALRVPGVKPQLQDHLFLFYGAGSANVGIASLVSLALQQRHGMSEQESRKHCWLVDSRGLVYKGRDAVSDDKAPFAHVLPSSLSKNATNTGLQSLVEALKPSALVGASTQAGSFTPGVLKEMAKCNERPLVFALSNPTRHAECTAEQAYEYTNGTAVFASGSPFAPVDKNHVPGQGNNCYIFPGLGLGVVRAAAKVVTDGMVLKAAQSLADMVGEDRLEMGCVYPDIDELLDISAAIAKDVWKQAELEGVAGNKLGNVNVLEVRDSMYEPGRVRMSGY